MTENDAAGAGDVVAFDLDEDGVPETLAVDKDAGGVAAVVVFDLDEDGTVDAVVVDADQDGVADAVAFDLDETDVDGEDPWISGTRGEITNGDEDAGATDDSLVTPPDNPADEDIDEAESDMRRMAAMDQYMWDRGVTDVP